MFFRICNRILRKFKVALSSWRFRWRFSIYAGKVRSDFLSIARSDFGKHINVRGAIYSTESSIVLGDFCSIAQTAEIGAEKNGCVIVGPHVSFGPRTIISTSGGTIKIGAHTSFFSDCIISGVVSIGGGCLFAKNVAVLSGTHQIYGDGTIRENDAVYEKNPNHKPYAPVTIGEDCWLGMNSVILPGVNLGRGVVVGANAVVTKDVPEYSIVGGVPATIIGSRARKN